MTNVTLERDGGTFTVPVTINGAIKLNFTIDSGASDVQIPADVVMTMIRSGTLDRTDFRGQRVYQLADGTTLPSYIFRIRSLQVGDLVMHDITGSITNANGSLLLGQSFLSRVSSWSMDNRRGVLVLGPEKLDGSTSPSQRQTVSTAQTSAIPAIQDSADSGHKARMEAYLSAGSQNNLSMIVSAYAEHVIYYGQVRSSDFIALDKQRYIKRWPQRSYRLRNETFSEKCSDDSHCMLSGMIDWSVSNPENGKSSSGVAEVDLGISDGEITFENSKVVTGK